MQSYQRTKKFLTTLTAVNAGERKTMKNKKCLSMIKTAVLSL